MTGASSVSIQRRRVDHLVGEGAVAQNLAEPLVDRAVGAVAEGGVLEDPHRHLGGDDARHRADGAVGVAGLEGDPARGGQRFRFGAVLAARPS